MNEYVIKNSIEMSRESGISTVGRIFSKLFVTAGALSLFTLGGCKEENYAKTPEASPKQELVELQKEDLVKRGEYLVTAIGCHDCHSPKRMGERGPEEIAELKLSGYPQARELPKVDPAVLQNGWMLMNGDLTAAVGPWGVSFAANITSSETGIGNWSLEQFRIAMKQGKFKGMENGRDLLPPMPWPNFAKLSNEDLEAIYYYLQSTSPVENIVPAPIPPTKLAAI